MELNTLRSQIDQIDDQLICLFCQRMEIAGRIADFKKANGLPVHIPEREQEKFLQIAEKAGPEMADYARTLFSTLFALSRDYQNAKNSREADR